jgi:hypothetical protein
MQLVRLQQIIHHDPSGRTGWHNPDDLDELNMVKKTVMDSR